MIGRVLGGLVDADPASGARKRARLAFPIALVERMKMSKHSRQGLPPSCLHATFARLIRETAVTSVPPSGGR